MEIALFQPDIAQNVGAALRLSACLGAKLHIIEPCGFAFDDKRIRRAGMDYMEQATYTRHESWEAFESWRRATGKRLVLLTTKTSSPLPEATFTVNDILLAGQESAGVPEHVAAASDARIRIPMQKDARSLNVAISLAMVLGEALRQTHQFPCSKESLV